MVPMKNSDYIIEQYRGKKLVRVFTPSGDPARPWTMIAGGRTYRRTSGWVLSKILPTLEDSSPFRTRAVPSRQASS